MTDEKLLASLAHPARYAALAMIVRGPCSPDDIAEATDIPLGTVAYHVRALAAAGLIELDHEERIRGATKHVYRLVSTNGLGAEVWALGDRLLSLGVTLHNRTAAS